MTIDYNAYTSEYLRAIGNKRMNRFKGDLPKVIEKFCSTFDFKYREITKRFKNDPLICPLFVFFAGSAEELETYSEIRKIIMEREKKQERVQKRISAASVRRL